MVIHGPTHVPYDIDIGPVMLSDWYHEDYLTILRGIVGTDLAGVTRVSDNNLINARNNYDCSQVGNDTTPCFSNAGLANFQFTPGSVHRLRLVNSGAEGMQKFSIDGHRLQVIAQDFVPIVPYDTEVVTLGIGQRTDVLVTGMSNPNGTYFMRSTIPTADGCSLAGNPDATAIVYYNGSAPTQTPRTSPWPAWIESLETQCGNDPLEQTVPWFPITPDPNPSVTQEITINFGQNETGNYGWSMNESRFRTNYNQPVLLLSKLGNNSYPDSPQWNVYNFGSNSSVRIVVNNNFTVNHPMHLHGHNMYVLSVGNGTWDGQTIVNPSNPTRRDVQIIPGNGHMVIQFDQDNPGVWPFHCHIAWHVSAGLSISVLERPDDIAKLPIPSIMAQTCRDWADFTDRAVVDQIDSGL
ncbi:multicopper oxidase [Phlyctema vagabunda]|uniref:Multicopper oxidase n=1 Tax=Phlyctema vagabunda TaxID=108571 RepID=A0ABR4PTH9_9HELO